MNQQKTMCTCGKSKTFPYCDHSHKNEDIATAVVDAQMHHCEYSHQNVSEVSVTPIPGKILLLMVPFWDPLVPPQGISHLKHFLQHHGYTVKTDDFNTKKEFRLFYDRYFDTIKKSVPKDHQANFFNNGQDVMRNHMLSYIHHEDEDEYLELLKIILYETFFVYIDDKKAIEIKMILEEFFQVLENYMVHKVITEKPEVIGITALRDTIGPAMFAFKKVKEKFPFIKTIMGGAIFSDQLMIGSPNFEFFLEKTPYIDHIVIGEGQLVMLKILKGELPATQKVFTKKDIGLETLGFTPLNFPDMSDFNVNEDYPYISGQISVSCPYQCSFCNVSAYFGKYGEKEIEYAVNEMETLYRKYGVQLFFMNDSLLNAVATKLSDHFIKSSIALYWDGYLRVDKAVCDPKVTLHWRRGGFYRARMGIESGSQRVLDMIHKGITPTQIKESLISLATAGIKTTAYWVIGHPGETEEDFLQTLELLEEVKDYIYEAECNSFIYGYTGQTDSDQWKSHRRLLFPEKAKDILVIQSWVLDTEPSREETYRRVNRFVLRCNELGIPNPYSLLDIHKADLRWKSLHKNAVPPLANFKGVDIYIDECRYVKQLVRMENQIEDVGDFGF